MQYSLDGFPHFDISSLDLTVIFNIPGQTKEALPLNSLNCYFETTPSDYFVQCCQERVRLNITGPTEFLYGHIPVAVVDAAYPEQTENRHGLRRSLDCIFQCGVLPDRNLYHSISSPFSYNLFPLADVR